MASDQHPPNLEEIIHSAARSAATEVLNKLQEQMNLASSAEEDFLSAVQAAAYLKIKLNTLYSKVEKGELACYRSGKRKLLFSKSELEQFIRSKRFKSNADISNDIDTHLKKNIR